MLQYQVMKPAILAGDPPFVANDFWTTSPPVGSEHPIVWDAEFNIIVALF
jgi:hypothetical protein